jgi:hypothetical protein
MQQLAAAYLNANLHICALHITSDGYHNIQIQANKQAKKDFRQENTAYYDCDCACKG